MVEDEAFLRIVQIDRNIAQSYVEAKFSPFTSVSSAYAQRAQHLALCGIVLAKDRSTEPNLRASLGKSTVGLRSSLTFLLQGFAEPPSMLSDDVWYLPQDKAQDDERDIIRITSSRVVYTHPDVISEMVSRHLSALLGFDFLVAIGTRSIDPTNTTERELIDFISEAQLIAAPAHDGDTFLVFTDNRYQSERSAVGR